MLASNSSTVISTERAFEPSDGPTMPRRSSRSIRRPARAKPTRSLRWSMLVEPSPLRTTSSMASASRSSVSARAGTARTAAGGGVVAGDALDVRRAVAVWRRQWATTLRTHSSSTHDALDALGPAGAGGEQQHVALADELLGARPGRG